MADPLRIVILGLSITSSWGNGHATTFRSLTRGLSRRGHSVLFLERDVEWYRNNCDLPDPPFATTRLYKDLEELFGIHAEEVRTADLVIVGSYVPQGIDVGNWACSVAEGPVAFYDIDTPVTFESLARNNCEYLSRELVSRYDCYLSFTGGPMLRQIEEQYGAPMARPLYCSVDAELYSPCEVPTEFDLGYLGTYSDDRQPPLEELMLQAARHWPQGQFVVAGPQYPEEIRWPENVRRIDHLPPSEHCDFYCGQRYTLNITRAAMIRAGYSPSVRLFEAAACGTTLISDWWEGLQTLFEPGREILISQSADETLHYLRDLDDGERRRIGLAARDRILAEHTSERRAEQLECYFAEMTSGSRGAARDVLQRRAETAGQAAETA